MIQLIIFASFVAIMLSVFAAEPCAAPKTAVSALYTTDGLGFAGDVPGGRDFLHFDSTTRAVVRLAATEGTVAAASTTADGALDLTGFFAVPRDDATAAVWVGGMRRPDLDVQRPSQGVIHWFDSDGALFFGASSLCTLKRCVPQPAEAGGAGGWADSTCSAVELNWPHCHGGAPVPALVLGRRPRPGLGLACWADGPCETVGDDAEPVAWPAGAALTVAGRSADGMLAEFDAQAGLLFAVAHDRRDPGQPIRLVLSVHEVADDGKLRETGLVRDSATTQTSTDSLPGLNITQFLAYQPLPLYLSVLPTEPSCRGPGAKAERCARVGRVATLLRADGRAVRATLRRTKPTAEHPSSWFWDAKSVRAAAVPLPSPPVGPALRVRDGRAADIVHVGGGDGRLDWAAAVDAGALADARLSCAPCPHLGQAHYAARGGKDVVCRRCAQGHFCPDRLFPAPCPVVRPLSPAGSTGPDACHGCEPGQAPDLDSMTCVVCPAGFFCPDSGPARPCPAEAPLSDPGATGILQCKAPQCGPGFYLPDGAQECVQCPWGSFCPAQEASATPCPPDRPLSRPGAAADDRCEPCPAGSFWKDGSGCLAEASGEVIIGPGVTAAPAPPAGELSGVSLTVTIVCSAIVGVCLLFTMALIVSPDLIERILPFLAPKTIAETRGDVPVRVIESGQVHELVHREDQPGYELGELQQAPDEATTQAETEIESDGTIHGSAWGFSEGEDREML